jgi:hypothetical protein
VSVSERGHELLEVLDRPVVHDGDRAAAVQVRVGVAVGRRPVGGPAGVADADRPGDLALGEHLLEVGQLAGLALHLELAVVVQDRHARAVVAAVLQPAQPVEHDLERLLVPDVAHDAAHG